MSQSDQPSKPVTQLLKEKAPSTRQTVKFLIAFTIGASLLFLSGLTLTGTVMALIVATPVLVLFSPILVPAAITVFMVISGFLFSGGCGIAAVTVLSWIYSYATGKQLPGTAAAKSKIAGTTRDMTERAKEYGQYVRQRAQEATRQSS